MSLIKSTQNTEDVSGETTNAADVDVSRSAVELHQESDAEYVESDNETVITISDRFKTSEHSSTPSKIKELHHNNENQDGLITEAHDEEGNIQYVLDKDDVQGLSQLHLAAERGDTETVKGLLMSSANVDVLDTKHNTPLHYASLNGQVDVVNLLLSKNADVNSRNALGQTSLHLAAVNGHLAIAQLLLDSKADVHVTDQFMKTPIHIAAMHGHCQLVQLLMNHSVLLICYGNTPLHLATKCGHTEVVQLLLNYGENPDATNLDGNSPLHLASKDDHLEVVEVLLRNNADVNIRNASGKTSLHIAAEIGYAEIVKAMIDNEGEVNAVDRNGNTALHYAANNGHCAVVNVLLKQTTEGNARTRSQLAFNKVPVDEFEPAEHPIKNKVDVGHTAEGGNVEMADTLLSHSSTVNAVCRGQVTPLHLAVEQEQAEIEKNVMINGANVNACNNSKMTALHLACQNGHTSIVKLLLDNHAIVDVTKQSEKTPFYLAAKNGHADISDLLLCRGLCDFMLTMDIQSPLYVAIAGGHTKVVEVISKHSCRISDKLTTDGHKLQENNMNLIETRGVIPAELLKRDGRRVSAGIVWRQVNIPMELKTGLRSCNALKLAVCFVQPEMVRILLSGDHCVYSEKDIHDSFRLMITRMNSVDSHEKCLSDLKQCMTNFGEIAEVLINSTKYNIHNQSSRLDTLFHAVMQDCECSSCRIPIISKWRKLKIQLIDDLIQLLLEKGADFDMKNSFGETPLITASKNDCCHAIELLFDWEHKSRLKLDLDARDRCGETALIKAAKGFHISAVQLLLNHKVSVNLTNNCGFTALHAAVFHEPKWADLQFFCKELHKGKFDGDDYIEIGSRDKPSCERETVDTYTVIDRLPKEVDCDKVTSRIKEQMVKLLLANDETNVNAIDLKGNTPLDLAVKSSKRITSATLIALKKRGAIHNSKEPEDEAPIEVARVDERGQNACHRFIIKNFVQWTQEDMIAGLKGKDIEKPLLIDKSLLEQENFRELASATDDKGRSSLHDACMKPSHINDINNDLIRVLLKIGSNTNATDMYGKIPLHYTENNYRYELLEHGADEYTKDKKGHTPRDLMELRKSVTINQDNAKKLAIGKKALYACKDIAQIFNTNHVTELTRHRLVEMIRIYSQSPRPQESSEEAIWKIWTQSGFIRLNRRLSQLNPLIQHFIERLADGIKKKDWRFECQPMLVGSANEETKAVISADFDFSFKLIKFSQFCDPFPHPLGPKGYFQLRRKTNEDSKSPSDEKFDSFFNSDQCLLTKEVNSSFQIHVEEVLNDPYFWQDEHLFEWTFKAFSKPAGLCMTVELKMIDPIADEEDGFLFVNISIDIVACVHVEGWWPEDPLPAGISQAIITDGCTFVFHRPRFDSSKPNGVDILFSDTFARISFAPLESRIIKESSPLMKAAYIVCKIILYSHFETQFTYQLKTCLLYCMEALRPNGRNGSETRNEDEIASQQLLFWVKRLMFCFMEFSRHHFYPCYFMPSFRQRLSVLTIGDNTVSIFAEQ